jgi:hypothetical protein
MCEGGGEWGTVQARQEKGMLDVNKERMNECLELDF